MSGIVVTNSDRSDIDIQISTAKQFPRNLEAVDRTMRFLVTKSEAVASDCMFALPRGKGEDGKREFVEGASIRFAETLASCYGNVRSGARQVSEENGYVLCEGFFHDLETNNAVKTEIRRRITDKYGKRYNADMITMTINAACSIARRNAVLQGIPRAVWGEYYDLARTKAIGDGKSIVVRRGEMFEYFGKMGIAPEIILSYLGYKSIEQITLDDLAVLKGIATAIKEGATTIDKAFATEDETSGKRTRKAEDILKNLQPDTATVAPAEDTTDEPAQNFPMPDEKISEKLQEIYQMLADIQIATGDLPDDTLDNLTNGKLRCQQDLQDKPLAYLNDICISVRERLGPVS